MKQKMTFGTACAVVLGLCAVFSLAGCDDYKAPHKKPKSPTQGGIAASPVIDNMKNIG